jgi:uroporphyrinogen decarboxylase
MTSKERFLAACRHETPDRVPIDYLADPQADRRLREHLGVESEEELLDALGCDFFYLPGRDISQNEGFMPYYVGPPLAQTDTQRVCPLGIRWQRGAYQSKFAVDEAIAGPLPEDPSPSDVLGHRWPTARDFDFSSLEGHCRRHPDRVLVGGLWTGILGDSYRMVGFQQFLTDMAIRPQVIHTLIDRMTEIYLELNDAVFSLLRGKLDVWFFGNDFGHQGGLLMSVAMWSDFFMENIRRLIAHAHGYGLRVMMHSCGSIVKLIPLLIEAGVEILDPVQVTALGMEPASLKQTYGQSVVFHGGIDVQRVLPNASEDEAHEHARQTIHTLGQNGGYIFAPTQIFQPDIPARNVAAAYRAAWTS